VSIPYFGVSGTSLSPVDTLFRRIRNPTEGACNRTSWICQALPQNQRESFAKRSYFIRFEDETFARAKLEMQSAGDYFVRCKSFYNPKAGIRNLEPSPESRHWGLRHSVREAGLARGRAATMFRQRKTAMLKTSAFVIGLGICAIGVASIVAPSCLAGLAQQFAAAGAFAFYLVALVRIAVGLILILAAPASRSPKALRVLGCVVLIVGIATGLTGLMAMGEAHSAIEWWLRQGTNAFRLAAFVILILGGFIAYACAPARRAA
jgi:hypothetical protein